MTARPIWTAGLYAAASWAAAALVTMALPNVIPWGSDDLFATLVGLGALALRRASPSPARAAAGCASPRPLRAWFIAIGVWLALWEFTTAKTGWLPKPFFSPPTGLLHVYVTDWQRLLICIGYSLRLWALGFGLGAIVGYVGGVALGWSKRFAYWGMPILKLIGPVPATAWIPCTFYFFPTTFDASVFIVALVLGHPGDDPDRLRRRLGQPRLLRRRPEPRRRALVSDLAHRHSGGAAAHASSACSWASTTRSRCWWWPRCSAPNMASAGTSSSRRTIPATPTSTRRW